MSESRAMNRWWVVVGAILVQLCLGAMYAWSAFTGKLTAAVLNGAEIDRALAAYELYRGWYVYPEGYAESLKQAKQVLLRRRFRVRAWLARKF